MSAKLPECESSQKRFADRTSEDDFVSTFCQWIDSQAAFMAPEECAESKRKFQAIVFAVKNRLCREPDRTH